MACCSGRRNDDADSDGFAAHPLGKHALTSNSSAIALRVVAEDAVQPWGGPALQLGVTVEEMRQMSMALMQLVPTEPTEVPKVGTSVGTSVVGTRNRMRNDLHRPRVSRRAA